MGSLHRLFKPGVAEVFSPVNPRPTEMCRVLKFVDGDGYAQRFDAVGVQYALGEQTPTGYHVIETPDSDGPLLRYIQKNRDGTVMVKLTKAAPCCQLYGPGEVSVLGMVFQWIIDFATGDRWERISGPAASDVAQSDYALPLYDLNNIPH